MTRCKRCGKTWGGLAAAHCATCHATFTTVGNFDRHRRGGECINPVRAGLVRNDRGQWAMPGRDDLR